MTVAYKTEEFSKYEPLIEAYKKARDDQMEKYDPRFYAACLEKLPSQQELDCKPIDATQFVKPGFGLLTEEEAAIVNGYSLQQLLAKQLEGKLTATEIAHAFIRASIIAQIATNCVMQFMFDIALAQAAKSDEFLRENKQLKGPLHGIPVSLKEHMEIKGLVTHASYISLIEHVSENTNVSIQLVENMGATMHVRTSQPQAIMHLDTDNNVIGRTRNPLSTCLSPGGSSGGESAIIGMHGSVLGIGSDIGGSIRCPAAFANLYGLRPTTKRFSGLYSVSGGKGQESVVPTMGPLARSASELNTFMDHYVNDGKPWAHDPSCVPLPWNTSPELPAKIRVGVLFSDGIVTPFPAVTRAMHEVVENLEKNPHVEVVDLKKHWLSEEDMIKAIETVSTLYTCDGNRTQKELLYASGEPILPLTKFFFQQNDGRHLSVYENRELNTIRDSTKLKIFQNVFPHCDFILSPAYAGPPEVPGESKYWGYTSLWNLVDYPNLTFPTPIQHDAAKDAQVPSLRDNEFEKMHWNDEAGKIRYDPKNYAGGYIALQLTGPRFQDEHVIAAAELITKSLGIGRR
ncbi:hypothetical protein ZYGR_0AZ00730 [Zygosaccharomyces rouxii]|uniref:amidase n=1 Tax=Zygosaccharomyces rouxii TaxID=4956 RepID=A0A1Q3AK03_ZYGRO|nr:hypothetical protein ZYGR_0AZ00730 [Zygosaccharomyces rouxii]